MGFLLLSMAALLGSFGNVFCEKLLKGGDREGLSLSQQNLRLYFFGIILNLLWTWFVVGEMEREKEEREREREGERGREREREREEEKARGVQGKKLLINPQ